MTWVVILEEWTSPSEHWIGSVVGPFETEEAAQVYAEAHHKKSGRGPHVYPEVQELRSPDENLTP